MKSGGPVSQIHSPHHLVGAPGIFSDLLRSVQMLKREWDAESNGKLLHLFIPNKTATLVPEFAVEDLPLDRTATLVSAIAVKDLPLCRTVWWYLNFSTVCITKNVQVSTTNAAIITFRKLSPVAVPNFEIRLLRHWQETIQPDNQTNHYNSLTHVVMGEK